MPPTTIEVMDLSKKTLDTNPDNNEKVIGIDGVPKEFVKLYLSNYKAHQVGISHEEMVKAYNEWAKSYDQETMDCYFGPAIAAKEMSKYYSAEERPAVSILDVAAGTGRVGMELVKHGFKNVDALEPSRGMLEILIGRKIYGKTFESAVGYEPVAEIAADSYDALVIAGGMGEGHIPVQAIDEFLRIVRPGGLITIVMREEYLSTVDAYSGKLEPFMESRVANGLWTLVQRTVVPNYSYCKNGVVYVYKKQSDAHNLSCQCM